MENKLKDIFSQQGIVIDTLKIQQFVKYYNLLIDCNKKFNLTAITEQTEVIVKHFLDSVLPYETISKNARVIDIGSGAGFPLLPLKILRPDLKIVLVDSLNKRIGFLQEVIQELGLQDVECIHSRAEDLAIKLDFRENFDYCVCRAVAQLNTLSELTLPFIKCGGKLLAYKGEVDTELKQSTNALKILGGKLDQILHFELPFSMGSRNIVIINKITSTPKKYPRGQNKPKSNPL